MLIEQSGVVDSEVLERTVTRFREAGIALPRFAQLADPGLVPERVRERLATIGPDDRDPLNLFRVHWYNDAARTGIATCRSTSCSRPS